MSSGTARLLVAATFLPVLSSAFSPQSCHFLLLFRFATPAGVPTVAVTLPSLTGEGLKNDKGAVLIMQNDGNLVPSLHTPFPPLALHLTSAHSGSLQQRPSCVVVVRSASLIMPRPHTPLLYHHHTRLLSPHSGAGTHGNAGSRFEVQSDGNLVVYKKSGQPIWNSRTHGKGPNCELQLQNDCNIVLYHSNSAGTYGPRDAVWASGTHC